MARTPKPLPARLDPHDHTAFLEAAINLQGPQAAFRAVHNLVVSRYAIGPMDSVDAQSGVITRAVPDPAPASEEKP